MAFCKQKALLAAKSKQSIVESFIVERKYTVRCFLVAQICAIAPNVFCFLSFLLLCARTGDAPLHASTGTTWGGVQGGLKSWGWDGRVIKPNHGKPPLYQRENAHLGSQQNSQDQTEQSQLQPTSVPPSPAHTVRRARTLSQFSSSQTATQTALNAWGGCSEGPDLVSHTSYPPQGHTTPLHHDHQDSCRSIQAQGTTQTKQRSSLPVPSLHLHPTDEVTPYAPGSSPLSSLSARHRASEILFSGALLASNVSQVIR